MRPKRAGGILVQSLTFGLTGPATALATDLTEGVIDRFRSLPARKTAYLLGHYLAELIGLILAATLLLIVGWRFRGDALGPARPRRDLGPARARSGAWATVIPAPIPATRTKVAAVKSTGLIALGVVLVLVGAIWTLQGLGVLGGSVMSGVTIWAIIGPIVALAGLALAVTQLRRRTSSSAA